MNINDIPTDIRDCLSDISGITKPDQGMTSDVVIVESKGKKFILKHSSGSFAAWLRYEYQVLLALEETRIPTAKVHSFTELQADRAEEAWMLADYIPGEQLTSILSSPDLTRDHRDNLFYTCGAALAAVHSVSPPACITNCGDTWLDTLISRAHIEQEKRALVFDKDERETQARYEALLRMERTRLSIEKYTLIHGNCSCHHLFFDGTDLRGIIDWGCAAIGDPRFDIAEILCVAPEWATREIDDDVISFFEGYGTSPISLEVIQYFQELSDMGGQGCLQIGLDMGDRTIEETLR